MAGADIERLRKIAALTASSSDGEALAALRKLQKALSDAGLEFADVIARGATARVPDAPSQTGNPFEDIFKAAADGFGQSFHRPPPRKPAPPRTRFVDPTDMPEGTFHATVKKVDGSSETTTDGNPMIWVHVQDKGEREIVDYGVCVAFGATASRISGALYEDDLREGEGVRMTLKVLSQKSAKHRPMIISAQF